VDCLNSSSLKGILVGYMAALLPQLLRVIQIFSIGYFLLISKDANPIFNLKVAISRENC